MAASNLIKPDLRQSYPEIARGNGVYLYDTDGNQYLDGCSGAVTAAVGHGVEEINRAIFRQASSVAFVYRTQFTNRAAEELAAHLSVLVPGESYHSFFVNSGSEANETAAKIAIQYWQERGRGQKNRILSRWMSYHGFTLGALSMSGHAARRSRYASILHDWPVLPSPYPYRSIYGDDPETLAKAYADELEKVILRMGSENVAAFIAEPILGAAGGVIIPPDGYFQRISEICTKYEVLLIVDEVMTGLGRTGHMLAINQWHVIPDIITLGKGLGAGYTSIAATLVRQQVLEEIQRNSGKIVGGHTLSANPLSCATALAVFEYIQDRDLDKRAVISGDYLRQGLQALQRQFGFIGDVRGMGLFWGMELVQNLATKAIFPAAAHVTSMLVEAAFQKGLLIYPAGGALEKQTGDAVIIAPPLSITESEIDELLDKLAAALSEVSSRLEYGSVTAVTASERPELAQ